MKRSERRDLLAGEEVGRLEVVAAADAVDDPALAGGPALEQGRRADARAASPRRRPVMTMRRVHEARAHHQVDHVADRLDVLDVVALELDAELVLDDLGELDEIERVDVEALEGRVAGDLAARRRSRSRPAKIVFSTGSFVTCVGIWFSYWLRISC